ncbi:MAG: PDZ domain-containing protein [Flavobacteriaceae bacterium]|jgi:C-terminal processing protease CtpA/Prc
MKNIISLFIVVLVLILSSCTPPSKSNKVADLAKSWVLSSYEGKDAAFKMVTENMSDNGYNIGSRYIGFGFNFNSDAMEENGMVVTNVIKGGPASSVLKKGDKFLSVNDVLVTQKSIDDGSLSFRGKPGIPVNAKILRDGEEISITVKRGIVEPRYSKEQILNNISNAVAEDWNENLIGYEIKEVVSDVSQKIVYVKVWDKYLDEYSGLEAEAYTLTRFEFNDEGKVVSVGNMTENELILRQTGWSITR